MAAEKKRAGAWAEATGAKRGRELYKVPPEELTIVGIDCADDEMPGLVDPRIHDPIRPELVASIYAHGVQQLVKVTGRGERLYVVDGRQRVRHAREANRQRVAEGLPPMRVNVEVISPDGANDGEEQRSLWITAKVANSFRLEDGPMRKAVNAKAAMSKFGLTAEEVAAAEGVALATMRQYLSLLRLDPAMQEAVEQGKITPTAAAGLVAMPASEQCEYLARVEAGEVKGTVAEVHKERAERKAKREKGEDYTAPITTREIKRMVEFCTSGAPPVEIDPAAFRTLKALAGLASPHGVRGLTALFRAIGRNVGTEGGE